MRYRLRTLLMLLAVGPPVLAPIIQEVRRYRARQHLKQIGLGLQNSNSVFDTLPPGARLRWKKIGEPEKELPTD
jgi:hypothetical protein